MSLPALKLVGAADPEPAIPSGGQWLSLPEASARCGQAISALRARCGRSWHATGLARKQPTATGDAWYIHESADAALKGVQFVEDINDAFDMARVSEKQRNSILFRERCVLQVQSLRSQQHRLSMTTAELYAAAARGINNDRQSPPLYPVSARSLERWYAAYFKAADNKRGRAGLVDARLDKTQVEDKGDYRAFFAFVEDWYLQQGEPKLRRCYVLARAQAARAGVTHIPSLSTTQRYVATLPEDKVILARQGVKAHDDHCAVFIQRDYTRIIVPGDDGQPAERDFRADDIWNCDHHICDVIVRDGVDANGKPRFIRPWLTPWLDMRSRKIVGYRFSRMAPDSSTVLLAFREAAYRAGMAVPRAVYIDNGKDFDAWFLQGQTKVERRRKIVHDPLAFSGVFGMLKIAVQHAKPYNAKAKPIERFFGTFEDQFGRFQKSYCGRDPQHKPERLPEVLKGKSVPTFEQYVNEASAWIDDVYHVNRHEGHGMGGRSPGEVYDATRHTIRRATEAELSVCLQKVTDLKSVNLRGIQHGKLFYGAGDPMLMQFRGQKVHLFIDPEDVRTVRVFSKELAYLCTVQCPELVPHAIVSSDEVRDAQARATRINNTTRAALRNGMRMNVSPTELLAEDAVAAARAREPMPEPDGPPTVELVQTGLNRDLIDVHPPLRQAAGGEHQPPAKSWLQTLAEED